MTATDARLRRAPWFRRALVALVLIVLVLAFGGWLRGRDQWGPFRGQVIDAESGAPLPNTNVMVTWRIWRLNLVDSSSDFWDARETVTDAQGRFELPRLWRLWTLNVLEPGIGYFAPGYIAVAEDVTPAGGVPYVDPTIVKMRPLKTKEERCEASNRAGVPLHDKAPRFRTALYDYDRELRCYEFREPGK